MARQENAIIGENTLKKTGKWMDEWLVRDLRHLSTNTGYTVPEII